jgi:hypothetical protein
MIKRLINSLKNQPIKDSYFGEMRSVYNEIENCYYLDKDVELEPIHTPVILYIVSSNQRSKNEQQEAFKSIKQEFSKSWINIGTFLTKDKKIITDEQLWKEYRLESLTIPIDVKKDKMKWEIDLLNLKDGFSRIIIEMKNYEPFHFSVEA